MPVLDMIARIAVFLLGVSIVGYTLISAVRTYVLPRGDNVWLTRMIFRVTMSFFRIWTKRVKTYDELDRIMALYAPLALLISPVI